jgi:uncharacterized protein
MNFPVMARMTASALGQYNQVNFIWHGGEPTLLPISFYEKAFLVQARLRQNGQWIGNSLQTNATRLTPAWARFFKANEIQVGISIDGPAHLHTRHRSYPSGKPSYEDVIRGLDLLKQYEVDFSSLVVVDEATLEFGAKGLFEFLMAAGIRSIGLLAAKPRNDEVTSPEAPSAHYVEPARISAFLVDLYDAWLSHGDEKVKIRELDGLKAQIRGEESGFCTLSGECWGHYYMIEPDGTVVGCDVFSGDPRYTLGNIMTSSFSELENSSGMVRLKEEHRDSLEAMKACPEFPVCKGWCPHERYVSIRHNKGHRNNCCGLRDLIVAIRDRMVNERDRLRSRC